MSGIQFKFDRNKLIFYIFCWCFVSLFAIFYFAKLGIEIILLIFILFLLGALWDFAGFKDIKITNSKIITISFFKTRTILLSSVMKTEKYVLWYVGGNMLGIHYKFNNKTKIERIPLYLFVNGKKVLTSILKRLPKI